MQLETEICTPLGKYIPKEQGTWLLCRQSVALGNHRLQGGDSRCVSLLFSHRVRHSSSKHFGASSEINTLQQISSSMWAHVSYQASGKRGVERDLG